MLLTIVEKVAALAERSQVACPIIGRVVIDMGGRQHHACLPKLVLEGSKIDPADPPSLPVAPGLGARIEPAAIAQMAEERYLVPEALPPSRPDFDWPEDSLRFRYQYGYDSAEENENTKAHYKRLEQNIGWTSSEDDPLGDQLGEAEQNMDAICHPVLLGRPNLCGADGETAARRLAHAVRLAGDRPGNPGQPGGLGARAETSGHQGQNPGARSLRSPAFAGQHF